MTYQSRDKEDGQTRKGVASPNQKLRMTFFGAFLILLFSACSTTSNHGYTIEKGKLDISLQSIYVYNEFGLQYGMTDDVTIGSFYDGYGLFRPGAAGAYTRFAVRNSSFDSAVTVGLLASMIGPFSVSPYASYAISKEFGATRPFIGAYADRWRASANSGLEQTWGPLVVYVSGEVSYYVSDMDQRQPDDLISMYHPAGRFSGSIIPGVSLRF